MDTDSDFGTQQSYMDGIDRALALVQRALLFIACAALLGWCWSQV